MFLIPLNQVESVELVVHALRSAAGQADCSQCPVRKVCMQQCLTIASSIEGMIANNMLPAIDPEEATTLAGPEPEAAKEEKPASKPFLKVVK